MNTEKTMTASLLTGVNTASPRAGTSTANSPAQATARPAGACGFWPRKRLPCLAREYVAAMDNFTDAIRAAEAAPDSAQLSVAVRRTNWQRAEAYRRLMQCASEVLKEQGALA